MSLIIQQWFDRDLTAPAAPTGAMTGSTSVVLAGTGAFSASGALSGIAPLVVAGTATLMGFGALLGSATNAFAATGTLQGLAAVTGTAPVAFTASGTLTGAGALSGTATSAFAGTGTLGGAGALSGSAAITLAGAGTFTSGGALSGSAALTVGSGSTSLKGVGALAGTAPIVAAGTGTLIGSGVLSGSSAAVFSASGTLGNAAFFGLTPYKLDSKFTTPGGGNVSITSNSFTPPNNSLLVVAADMLTYQESADPSTDLTITDSAGLTWTRRVTAGDPNYYAMGSAIWTAPVTTGVSMTVTAGPGSHNADTWLLAVMAFTGYNSASPIGATASGALATSGADALTLSGAPNASSQVIGVASAKQSFIANSTGKPAPGSGFTEQYALVSGVATGAITMEVQARGSSTSTSVPWATVNDDPDSGEGVNFNTNAMALEIKAAMALAGTAPSVIAGSGTLGGAGALSGAAPCAFTGTGTLKGAGALSGTSPAVFVATGTLQGLAGVTGSAPVIFTASGTLKGAGALSGTAPCVIAGSSTLTGKGALVGTASVALAGTGSLGSNGITGAASLGFSATATFSGALIRTNLDSKYTNPTGSVTSITSNNFTPPNNSLLVVIGDMLEHEGSTDPSAALTITDSVGLSWTRRIMAGDSNFYSMGSAIWTAPVATGVSMNVTLGSGGRSVESWLMAVVAYTGYDPVSPIGATASGALALSGPASLTLSAAPNANSQVIAVASAKQDFFNNSTGKPTPGAGFTEQYAIVTGVATGATTMEVQTRAGSTSTNVPWATVNDDPTPGENLNFNTNAMALEIRAAGTSGGADFTVFPDWPMMRTGLLQTDIDPCLLDATSRTYTAKKNAVVIQPQVNSSGFQAGVWASAMAAAVAANPNLKLGWYLILEGLIDNTGADWYRRNLIDGSHGHAEWYLRNRLGTILRALYAPSVLYQYNPAGHLAALNDLGQSFPLAEANEFNTTFTASPNRRQYVGFIYFDAANDTSAAFQDPTGTDSAPDYNQDGVADAHYLSTANDTNVNPELEGGQVMQRRGLRYRADVFESVLGMDVWGNAAEWAGPWIGGSFPKLPLSAHQYYGKWAGGSAESWNHEVGLIGDETDTYSASSAYHIGPYGARVENAFKYFQYKLLFIKNDADTRMGRAVLMPSCVGGNGRAAKDYEYYRFFCAFAMMFEKAGSSLVDHRGAGAVVLDEEFIQFGNPVAPRYMATINDATGASTLRNPDYVNGSARFFWTEYETCLVVMRTDSTGGTPSTGYGANNGSAYPWGSAVDCALPNPGPGKKWQRFNASTYPRMGAQDTSVNSGTDVVGGLYGVDALKPYTARFYRRVSTPGAIEGSASLGFSAFCTLKGAGALNGLAPLVVTTPATLTGVAAGTGTATLTLGTNATLASSGGLNGVATLLVNAVLSLNGISPPLSGLASLRFSAAAYIPGLIDRASTFVLNAAYRSVTIYADGQGLFWTVDSS